MIKLAILYLVAISPFAASAVSPSVTLDVTGLATVSVIFGYLLAGRVAEVRTWLRERRLAKLRAAYEAVQANRRDPHAHPIYAASDAYIHDGFRTAKIIRIFSRRTHSTGPK